jgi:DNA topoisomerase-2
MASKKITSESTLQHLHRKPDNYIGGNSITEQTMFVYENDQIVNKLVDDWNEPLIHIFKEAIDNASDNVANKWHTPQSYIDIKVDRNSVQVTNDGMPIHVVEEEIELPNEITKKIEVHKLWRSQALFNYFRTGTNAKNGEKDDSIGTNGIGSKSIWAVSKYAKLHHGDPDNQKQLVMEYHDKMSKISEPKITAYKSKKSFTTFYYEPDFEWFGFTKFSKNHIGIMHAMAVCLAYTSKIKVIFNDKEIKVPTLKKLGEMFFGERNSIEFKNANGDSVLVMEQSLEEMETFGIRQLAFVNGSFTRDGGIHVDRNATKIGKFLAEAYGSGLKGVDASKFFIYIANYKISTPDCEWTGQTKAGLKGLKNKKQLKHVDVEKKDFNKCKKWELWGQIAIFLEGKTNRVANAKEKGTTNAFVGKGGRVWTDANEAGKAEKLKCELYIAEGNSAKSLIEAGLNYRGGNDYVGVLAIRGKLNNVKKIERADQDDKVILKNIRKLMGLKMGCKYMKPEEIKTLRYGRLIIASDQDLDGYHIRGLIYCFIESEHFGLIEHGVLSFLQTPVIKTFIGKVHHRFYLREDFSEWIKELPENQRNTAVKNCRFIKGLGGNDDEEDAKFIFGDSFSTGQLLFKKAKDRDAMDIFFGGKRVNEKKAFMFATFYNEEWVHLPKKGDMTFREFIEYIYTGTIDEQVRRAIPCVYDGLIESKKEILWTALNYLTDLEGTNQFASLVYTKSSYEHGDQNLAPTVTKMAQNIIGKNNITYFIGDGIFGNRFQHSDDGLGNGAAAGRYTRVGLQPLMKVIFRKDDDPILHYKEKDGTITSPEYYLPIVPWFAINGIFNVPANTWSCASPSYNPEDLIEWIKWWISQNFKDTPAADEKILMPWYRGFRGTIETTKTGWEIKGTYEKIDAKNWRITEIPAGVWGVKIQESLEDLAISGNIDKPRILNLDRNTCNAEFKVKKDFDIEKFLSDLLTKKFAKSNITFINKQGPLTTNNIEEHLDLYCRERYSGYQRRRKYKIDEIQKQISAKQEKIRYIYLVLDSTINFKKIRDREHLIEMLEKHDFKEINGWDYITNMTHLTTSQRSIDRLEKDIEKDKLDLAYYTESKPWKIWIDELEEFAKEYKKYLADNPMNQKFKVFKPKQK